MLAAKLKPSRRYWKCRLFDGISEAQHVTVQTISSDRASLDSVSLCPIRISSFTHQPRDYPVRKELIVKKLLVSVLMLAMFTSPLFAAKRSTVSFTESASVGSTLIAAGEYKLSYEGAGPTVKVTLTREGKSPIVLDAKLTAGSGQSSVTYSTENGVRTLREIDLTKVALLFEGPAATNQ